MYLSQRKRKKWMKEPIFLLQKKGGETCMTVLLMLLFLLCFFIISADCLFRKIPCIRTKDKSPKEDRRNEGKQRGCNNWRHISCSNSWRERKEKKRGRKRKIWARNEFLLLIKLLLRPVFRSLSFTLVCWVDFHAVCSFLLPLILLQSWQACQA